MPEPVIETLEDWNFRLGQCGCCGMPTCPTPTMVCQSLELGAITEGYFKEGYGQGDAVWTLYATYTESLVQSSNYSENNTDGPFSSGYTYAATLNKSTTWSYSGNISIQSAGFCISETIDPPSVTSCTNSLSETITSFYQSVDDGAVYERNDYSYTRNREDISGDDNPAHADWEVAADAWDAQPPEEREGERPPEPVEFYPECTFIDNITETSTTLDGNVTGFPRTYTEGYLTGIIGYPGYTSSFTRTYGGGIGYAEWVSAAKARVDAKTFSDSEDPECYGNSCNASYALTPEPVAPEPEEPVEGEPPPPAPTAPPVDLSLSVTKVRYRWRIPSIHAGTYFKITWDVLEEPEGWDIAPPVPPVEPDTVSAPGAEPVELITNPSHVVWEDNAEAWDNAWYPPADAPPYPVDEPSEQITNPDYTTWLAADAAYNSYLADYAAYLAAVVVYDEAVIAWDAYIENHPEWVARHRSLVSQDNVVVWAGPGTPIPAAVIVDDEITNQAAIDAATATWLSGWYDLDPPTEPGTKRVVNIRFECYGVNDYGNKPQVTGEAYEIPD